MKSAAPSNLHPTKIFGRICHGLGYFCLFVLIITSIMSTTKADTKESKSYLMPVEQSDGGPLLWLKKGKLFRLRLEDYRENVYVYQPQNGKPFIVSNSRYSVSRMLSSELDNAPDLESVVLPKLDKILFTLLTANSSKLIDNYCLQEYAYMLEEKPAAEAKFSETIKILKKCVEDSFVHVDKNEWSLKFFVANRDGSLEQWTASGEVRQLNINKISIETKLASGTLLLLPVFD